MRKFIIAVLMLTGVIQIHAQSRFSIASFPQLKQYVNSALTGYDGSSVHGFYRNQITSFDKSPQYFLLSGETKLTDLGIGDASRAVTHNLGLSLSYDRVGNNKTAGVNLSYAAAVKISTALNLRGGLAVTYDRVDMETSSLSFEDDNDPALQLLNRDQMINKFGLNLGLALTGTDFYAGYSAYDVAKSAGGYQPYFEDTYILQHTAQAGYRYAITPGFGLIAGAAYHYDESRRGVAEGHLKTVFKNTFLLGGGYRQDVGTILTAGARFGQIQLGYSRELNTHPVNGERMGANEIVLSYHFTPVLKTLGRSITIW